MKAAGIKGVSFAERPASYFCYNDAYCVAAWMLARVSDARRCRISAAYAEVVLTETRVWRRAVQKRHGPRVSRRAPLSVIAATCALLKSGDEIDRRFDAVLARRSFDSGIDRETAIAIEASFEALRSTTNAMRSPLETSIPMRPVWLTIRAFNGAQPDADENWIDPNWIYPRGSEPESPRDASAARIPVHTLSPITGPDFRMPPRGAAYRFFARVVFPGRARNAT